jgi:hypothetical protein
LSVIRAQQLTTCVGFGESAFTGMSHLINALSSKRLGLLRELVPTAATFGLPVDPTNPNTERRLVLALITAG